MYFDAPFFIGLCLLLNTYIKHFLSYFVLYFMNVFIENLKKQFKFPLPGKKVQYEMATAFRNNLKPPPENASKAAVMTLFYQKNNSPHFCLIQRVSTNKQDRHSGQISFPGGKYEPEDKDLEYTALRETYEEIGVPIDEIHVIGELTELYIPVSNFLVFPFVGYINTIPNFALQESEVENIIEIPFQLIKEKDTRQLTDIKVSANLTLKKVPYFNVYGKVVWGATAMILNELTHMVKAID